jgi:hypothetical protein
MLASRCFIADKHYAASAPPSHAVGTLDAGVRPDWDYDKI